MERRLDKLEVLWQRRYPALPTGDDGYDITRLSTQERDEFDAIMNQLTPNRYDPTGLDVLSLEDLERLVALSCRMRDGDPEACPMGLPNCGCRRLTYPHSPTGAK